MLKDSKYIKYLSALCFIAYFTSYITRINYGAIVAEIVTAEGILKSSASFVITAGFISYGIGQLISGFLGDRLSPKKIIFWGLIATSVLNLLMPFCKTVHNMIIVWVFNGFAQAMLWPPLVKILSTYLSKEDFRKSCVTVAISSSAGTIAVYLFAPMIIYLSGWRTVFFVSGTIGMIIAFIWILGVSKIESHSNENNEQQEQIIVDINKNDNISLKNLIFPSGLIFIAIGLIMQGILKDGVTTWMPSYISETFNLDSSISILSAVVLPVFSIICFEFASFLQKKVFTNELTCATVMFFAGFSAIVVLVFLSSYSVFLSIALASIITGCMHGVNFMLNSLVPVHFNKFGNVSRISGMLNFFSYTGSALSIYGIAKLSEVCGWQYTVFVWAVIAFIGTIACFVCIRKWERFCG
ncbi:MAG: MFS transporter [Clostridiaceae bacterium]|nr:MFS transporter [Clostridiaceae bacterium]